jgi:hypothetical protein
MPDFHQSPREIQEHHAQSHQIKPNISPFSPPMILFQFAAGPLAAALPPVVDTARPNVEPAP